jgi:hypothetical protein
MAVLNRRQVADDLNYYLDSYCSDAKDEDLEVPDSLLVRFTEGDDRLTDEVCAKYAEGAGDAMDCGVEWGEDAYFEAINALQRQTLEDLGVIFEGEVAGQGEVAPEHPEPGR